MQTYQPEHPVIRAILAGDEEGFWRAEAAERRGGRGAALWPDGGDHPQRHRRWRRSSIWATRWPATTRRCAPIGAQVYGPAPAPIARIRGRHRVRLLVKAGKGAPLQEALARWIAPVRLKGDLRLSVDIDPQSFL